MEGPDAPSQPTVGGATTSIPHGFAPLPLARSCALLPVAVRDAGIAWSVRWWRRQVSETLLAPASGSILIRPDGRGLPLDLRPRARFCTVDATTTLRSAFSSRTSLSPDRIVAAAWRTASCRGSFASGRAGQRVPGEDDPVAIMKVKQMVLGLPDLHSEVPELAIPVRWVGHSGVRRVLTIADYPTPASVLLDVSVGLHAEQRGGHMSRLIDSLPWAVTPVSLHAYVAESMAALRAATPDAARWRISAKADFLFSTDGGAKPMSETVVIQQEAERRPKIEWGGGLRVCLACPQAQAVLAARAGPDHDDVPAPSHNQVCDLSVRIAGHERVGDHLSWRDLVAVAEAAASGPVRERQKRQGEADVVATVHRHARFAEDALREISHALRAACSEADRITVEIVNHESIFEYPLYCRVDA
jgi:GTP cyclohydrolase FolE2